MNNKLLTTLIGLAVAIICVATVLMPAITDASTDIETASNEYDYKMRTVSADETITLTVADSKPYMNGEVITATNSEGDAQTTLTIVADSFIVITYGGVWNYYFVDDSNNVQIIYSTATGANTAAATIHDGTMSVQISESVTFTVSYTVCYVPDEAGTFANGNPVIIDPTTSVVVYKPTRTGNGVAIGTIDNPTTQYHITDGTEDSDSYTFTTSFDEVKKGNTTLYQTSGELEYIVPLSYTYQVSTEYATLYGAIPVMAIIGILLAAVGMIVLRKD